MKTYKEKGVGQGHGEPKIATVSSLFGSRETSHYYVLSAVNFDASALSTLIR